MIRRAVGAIRRRLRRPALTPIPISQDVVEKTITSSGAEPWHIWGVVRHSERGEAVATMRWIVANVPRGSRIFETACGAAANLLWLAGKGYRHLQGAELDAGAVTAAKTFASLIRARIEIWHDNSLTPDRIPEVDVTIALNWTYLRSVDFDFLAFLKRYGAHLPPGGMILMDVVDRSFDSVPNNEYQTDDWHLPADQRRPTQYKLRMSGDEVLSIAGAGGFEVIDTRPATEMPPRLLYVLRKREK